MIVQKSFPFLAKKKTVTDLEVVKIEYGEEKLKEKIQIFNSTYTKLKKEMKFPTDYIELQKFLIKIGELGEKFVYEKECSRLGNQESTYVDMIDVTPANNPANGFDILSYTKEGEKIYIEVKATVDCDNTPFFMSEHELSFAKKILSSGGIYQIHRVYNIMNDDENQIGYEVYDSLDKLEFTELSYKVKEK